MNLTSLAARAARMLPAETAHSLTIAALSSGLVAPTPEPDDLRLATTLKRSGLILTNPIGLAAGFDKNAEAFTAMLGFGFGFVECGTVTPRPQPGNPRPRLFRLPEDGGVINRMGFNNEGLGPFVRRLAGRDKTYGVVGANVGANKDSTDRIADYVACIKGVWPHPTYLTINISSPNTPGLRGLQDRGALEELLGRAGEAVREMTAVGVRPVFLKVAPDLDEAAIDDIVTVAEQGDWLAGFIVSNTTLTRPPTLRSAHQTQQGGLSGRPLFDLSTRVLAQFAARAGGRFDLIGAGGIASGADVVAKLRAGASAVQLYSAMALEGPEIITRIKTELLDILESDGVTLADLQKG